jgi:hypothetical protein
VKLHNRGDLRGGEERDGRWKLKKGKLFFIYNRMIAEPEN